MDNVKIFKISGILISEAESNIHEGKYNEAKTNLHSYKNLLDSLQRTGDETPQTSGECADNHKVKINQLYGTVLLKIDHSINVKVPNETSKLTEIFKSLKVLYMGLEYWD